MEKLIIKEKLPKAFKNKWIKALRSGKYKQGDGQLYNKDDNSYCCLGVAGAICKIKGIEKNSWLKGIKGISKIPKIIQGNDNNPVVQKLAKMNDMMTNHKHKYSFKRIATWIEKFL